jgi:hypothetical protein
MILGKLFPHRKTSVKKKPEQASNRVFLETLNSSELVEVELRGCEKGSVGR